MACARCGDPDPVPPRRWCAACERAYDEWSRRHAADIAWSALVGMVVVAFAGMGLPLLGLNWLAAASGVFAGFGAFVGTYRLTVRRRRRQYLQTGGVPRAYLSSTSKT